MKTSLNLGDAQGKINVKVQAEKHVTASLWTDVVLGNRVFNKRL